MTDIKHTPTPWVIRHIENATDKWPVITNSERTHYVADLAVNKNQREDNAAFIVRACNSFYEREELIREMVEALESATEQLEKSVMGESINTKLVNVVLEREVLGRAKGAINE